MARTWRLGRLGLGYTAGETESAMTSREKEHRDDVRLELVGQRGDVDQSGDVNRKLYQDGQQYVEVEDVSEGSFAGELLDGLEKPPCQPTDLDYTHQGKERKTNLSPRDTQEANGHEHPSDRNLVISKFDAVEVEYTQTVRRDEAVKREDLVHLDGRDECAAALADDVRD